jgi:hypothetical protein
MLLDDENKIKLKCLYQRKVFELTEVIEGLNKDTKLTFLFSDAEETQFLV